MLKKYLIFVLLAVAFSCSEQKGNGDEAKTVKYDVPTPHIAAGYKGRQLIKSVSQPTVTVVKKHPTVIATNNNKSVIGSPKIVSAGIPKMFTPGKGSLLLPVKTLAKGILATSKLPRPQPSLPLRMKDAATSNIQYLDVDQGINSSYIRDMVEDRHGNIWFATVGGGVSKYNGKTFSHYTIKNGLSSNTIKTLLEDKTGNIWFGTSALGVNMYDGENFISYNKKNGFGNDSVRDIIEDKHGNIWFATDDGAVKFNGKYFYHYSSEQGLFSDENVRTIFEDKKGYIWFGTYGAGISKFDGRSFANYTIKEGLHSNEIRAIAEDKNGDLWFGSDGKGVCRFDGEAFYYYTEKEGLHSNFIRDITADSSGNLWFGSDGSGVCRFDGKSFTTFTENEGLSSNSVWAIMQDHTGNLWFGTDGGGVCKYDEKSFIHFTKREGLSNAIVWSVLEDNSGDLWFSTQGGGINHYDGSKIAQYTTQQGLTNDIVLSSRKDKKGNLWFGTYEAGVNIFSNNTFTKYSTTQGLSHNTITNIFEDSKDNIWFATENGINKSSRLSLLTGNGTIEQFTENEGLCGKDVRAIIEDKKGNLWFGTSKGVSKYDGRYFTNYTKQHGLTGINIRAIMQDSHGDLWFATSDNGVSRFDGKTFTNYTEFNGLGSNTTWSLIEDKKGNVWVGTEKGLNCFVIRNKTDKINSTELGYSDRKIITFHKEDGLKSEDFYQNSAFIDSKNQLWLGSGKALTMLDLNKFSFNENAPKIQLENILLKEKFINYRRLKQAGSDSLLLPKTFSEIQFSSVAPFYNFPIDLELPYYLNHLTFNFNAMDWSAPHKIRYTYLLEGLDNSWSELTAENTADYRNIPPGAYIFKIKAIGQSQKWSEVYDYKFTVNAPWWQRWWAYILFSVLMIILVIFIVWLNIRRLKKRAADLNIKVENATVEIREQKELIEEKHKEITDSISYAERIQRALLASEKILQENLGDYFILFKPKDIVSGDFYWAKKMNDGKFILVTADSTGHGVPGAIMSILNISSLDKAIASGFEKPDEILNETRRLIIESLKNDGSAEGGKDGMDGTLLSIDFKNKLLYCSGANNPVWIVREVDNEMKLIEIKTDRMPIGKHEKDDVPFSLHTVALQKNDMIYSLTDGFADQFGGPAGKKFKSKQLQALILSIAKESTYIQKQTLSIAFNGWRGNLEQVDDVCITGIRI